MTFGGGLPPITFLQVETWRCSVVGPDSLGTSAKLCFKRFKAEAVDSAVRKKKRRLCCTLITGIMYFGEYSHVYTARMF